jgi:holliday junction DNA helicase RuvA
MIGRLTGTIVTENRNPLIIDVAGVGYRVFVPSNALPKLLIGTKQVLSIYTSVKDDAIDLFGFQTPEEIDIFELLLTVSGIGPKTALLVINRGVAPVTHAIMDSDVDFFTTIPRLGRKNAQKIIIELKSKLGSLKELDLSDDAPSETKDIIDALLSMGFDKKEITTTLAKMDTNISTDEKIKKAIKLLGKPMK